MICIPPDSFLFVWTARAGSRAFPQHCRKDLSCNKFIFYNVRGLKLPDLVVIKPDLQVGYGPSRQGVWWGIYKNLEAVLL
jgi:hypothetical protein